MERAKEAAIDLIKAYVLRGDTYESLKAGCLGAYCTDYHASIGGYHEQKKINNDKIIVEKVDGKECFYVFSLKGIMEEILRDQVQLNLFGGQV